MNCPKCKSQRFYFVQQTTEYHSFESFADETGYLDLIALEDSYPDDSQPQYIWCEDCEVKFSIHGKELI